MWSFTKMTTALIVLRDLDEGETTMFSVFGLSRREQSRLKDMAQQALDSRDYSAQWLFWLLGHDLMSTTLQEVETLVDGGEWVEREARPMSSAEVADCGFLFDGGVYPVDFHHNS